MPYATSGLVVSKAIRDLLDAAKVPLGLADVWFGPETDIAPTFPCAYVESFPKDRDFKGTRQFGLTFRVSVTVLFGKVQSPALNKEQAESLVEAVEAELHKNHTLDGKVIFGYVQRIEPGVTTRKGEPYRASRLLWTGTSREVF